MISIEDVREVEKFATPEAQGAAIKIIMSSKTAPARKVALCENIKKARDTKKVVEILWNVILSGEKMGTFSSNWNKKFR